MEFFRRNKNKIEKHEAEPGPDRTDRAPRRDEPVETSPQRVGIVSGILSTSADSDGLSQFASVVERRFAPDPERDSLPKRHVPEGNVENHPSLEEREEFVECEPLRVIEPSVDEEAESLKLEVDPMAHIGHATTITGDIVAEEDLEIQGTIEGSVRLPDHRVTVGSDGIVNATVDAHTVLVIGKITGNVVATELVEIKSGGVVGGDVKAPRVIMNDGAIVIGKLDMSAALPSRAESPVAEPSNPERPRLMRVELADPQSSEEEGRFE